MKHTAKPLYYDETYSNRIAQKTTSLFVKAASAASLVVFALLSPLSHADKKDPATIAPPYEFSKIMDSKELFFDAFKLVTFGLAQYQINSLLFGKTLTVNLSQSSFNTIQSIVKKGMNDQYYKEALDTSELYAAQLSTYRREPSRASWSNNLQTISSIAAGLEQALNRFDEAGYSSNPHFIRTAALYRMAAIEHIELASVAISESEGRSLLAGYQPKFAWIVKDLQHRIDWTYTSQSWITLKPIRWDWSWRRSESGGRTEGDPNSRWRGFYTPAVIGLQGTVLWEGPRVTARPLVKNQDRSIYDQEYPRELLKDINCRAYNNNGSPCDYNDSSLRLNDAVDQLNWKRRDHLKYNGMDYAPDLKTKFEQLATASVGMTNFSDMRRFSGGTLINAPGKWNNGSRILDGSSQQTLLWGPYMSFDYDVVHPVFTARMRDLPSVGTNATLFQMNHAIKNGSEQVIASEFFRANDFPNNTQDDFAFWGINQDRSFAGQQQEIRLWRSEQALNYNVRIRSLQLVGFKWNARALPEPSKYIPDNWANFMDGSTL